MYRSDWALQYLMNLTGSDTETWVDTRFHTSVGLGPTGLIGLGLAVQALVSTGLGMHCRPGYALKLRAG